MSAGRRVRSRRFGDDRGAELIELAIVMPLLLLMFAAMLDFGFLFQRYEVLTNAAREGARLGVVQGYQEADVKARVQNYLAASGLDAVPDGNITVTTAPETIGSGTISVVRVVVEYDSPFSFIGPFAGVFGGTDWTSVILRASSTMRVEGAASGS